METEYHHDLVIIFGSGKFGKIAFDHFRNTDRCIIIDHENYSESFGSPIEYYDNYDIFLQMYGKTIYVFKTHVFIKGSVETLFQILSVVIPKFLIPVAPIHVMAEIMTLQIKQMKYFLSSHEKLNDILMSRLTQIPKNLNYSIDSWINLYFSYAKSTELCLDNCSGPQSFCPNFQREKPETVSDFVNRLFDNVPQLILFHFISEQIIPGLGGIKGETIIKESKKLKSLYISNQIVVATTCNCHGVVTIIVL